MSLREELTQIRNEAGKLTSAVVVEKASDPSHSLHSRFEWDDSTAGARYRLHQASELIRSVEWEYTQDNDGAPKKVRAFHSVNRVDGPEYVPIGEIQQDPFMSKLVLESAKREFLALKRKHGHLEEFLTFVRNEVAS